jgi:glycosyltransferase EpsE
MKNPKVSVIMSTYNSDFKKLNEAIQSIKEQTFTDWEFIICDDASTNCTYERLQAIIKNDDRIKVFKLDVNEGAAGARNACLKYTVGKYIAIMDDDDISYNDRLLEQVKVLDDNSSISMVSSNVDIFDGISVIGKRIARKLPTKEDFLWGLPFVHPATMFRATAIKKINGYSAKVAKRQGEDYDLFMRLYACGYSGMNIQKVLFRYFVNQTSMNKRKFPHYFDEAKIRYNGFKLLGILYPVGWIYIFKPLLAGLIPKCILFNFQRMFQMRS